MSELPAPVEAVCSTFLSAVPDGLVTGLYLHGGIGFGEWVEESRVIWTSFGTKRQAFVQKTCSF